MPEEQPKSEPQPAGGATTPPAIEVSATNTSPAPSEIAGTPPGGDPGEPAVSSMVAEPLTDGTLPTVLQAGATPHKSSKRTKATLGAVYRKADIMTTLYTFLGMLAAAGIVFGAYYFLNHTNVKKATPIPVTKLDGADLEKLKTFFGSNAIGNNSEVLTVTASSLFKNRVALGSDLKVVGGVDVAGATNLGDLAVTKVATLGVVNARGSLTVAGPTVLQSPAILSAGVTVNGNVVASGNGTFGGSISAGVVNARELAVANLNLSGHIVISGQVPSAGVTSLAGTGGFSTIDGTDSAGTVVINTGTVPASVLKLGGLLGTVTFKIPYPKMPRVLITPIGSTSASIPYYIQKSPTGFTIGVNADPRSSSSYAFDYWVIQ